MTDASAFISRRRRAAAVLGETLWWGRFVAALGAVFLVRLIGLTADKFLPIPVGVEGSARLAAYCLVFALTPMHLTWEMRSTCPLLMVVWPARGELGQMPRRAGHRPDIAAGRRRFQKWHAW